MHVSVRTICLVHATLSSDPSASSTGSRIKSPRLNQTHFSPPFDMAAKMSRISGWWFSSFYSSTFQTIRCSWATTRTTTTRSRPRWSFTWTAAVGVAEVAPTTTSSPPPPRATRWCPAPRRATNGRSGAFGRSVTASLHTFSLGCLASSPSGPYLCCGSICPRSIGSGATSGRDQATMRRVTAVTRVPPLPSSVRSSHTWIISHCEARLSHPPTRHLGPGLRNQTGGA